LKRSVLRTMLSAAWAERVCVVKELESHPLCWEGLDSTIYMFIYILDHILRQEDQAHQDGQLYIYITRVVVQSWQQVRRRWCCSAGHAAGCGDVLSGVCLACAGSANDGGPVGTHAVHSFTMCSCTALGCMLPLACIADLLLCWCHCCRCP
jgi:hypothetical protein